MLNSEPLLRKSKKSVRGQLSLCFLFSVLVLLFCLIVHRKQEFRFPEISVGAWLYGHGEMDDDGPLSELSKGADPPGGSWHPTHGWAKSDGYLETNVKDDASSHGNRVEGHTWVPEHGWEPSKSIFHTGETYEGGDHVGDSWHPTHGWADEQGYLETNVKDVASSHGNRVKSHTWVPEHGWEPSKSFFHTGETYEGGDHVGESWHPSHGWADDQGYLETNIKDVASSHGNRVSGHTWVPEHGWEPIKSFYHSGETYGPDEHAQDSWHPAHGWASNNGYLETNIKDQASSQGNRVAGHAWVPNHGWEPTNSFFHTGAIRNSPRTHPLVSPLATNPNTEGTMRYGDTEQTPEQAQSPFMSKPQ